MIRCYDFVEKPDAEPILGKEGIYVAEHPFDALQGATGATLLLVEVPGTSVRKHGLVVATEQQVIARLDAKELLRGFARQCALDVKHLWNCPKIVWYFLATGDEELRAGASDALRMVPVWDGAEWKSARGEAFDAAQNATDPGRTPWKAAKFAAEHAEDAAVAELAERLGVGRANPACDRARDRYRTLFKSTVDSAFERSR